VTDPLRRAPLPLRASVRPGYWFRPRRLGWGASPATWQGWLLTLAFVLVAVLLARIAEQRGPVWLALLVPLLIGFVGLAWTKTDGEWRWRWGRPD
jgi:hypothetical protein